MKILSPSYQLTRTDYLKNQYAPLFEKLPEMPSWDEVLELDPTPTKKHLSWVCKQVSKGNLLREDFYKVPLMLVELSRASRMMRRDGLSTDLNRYEDLPAINRVLSSYEDQLSSSELSAKERSEIDSETEYLVNDNELLLVSPKTQRASCFWGRGTKWCTASTVSFNAFSRYVDASGNGLFIFVDKFDGSKFQLSASGQFLDSADSAFCLEKKRELFRLAGLEGAKKITPLLLAFVAHSPDFASLTDLSFADSVALVKNTPAAIGYLPQTPEFVLTCVSEFPGVVAHLPSPDQSVLLFAVDTDPSVIGSIPREYQYPDVCLRAVEKDGMVLDAVEDQTVEICLAAVKQRGWALKHVREQTPEICLAAVKQSGWTLNFVEDKTIDLCLAAYQQLPSSVLYSPFSEEELLDYQESLEPARPSQSFSL